MQNQNQNNIQQIYKYRLKVRKNKELKFISHLDWQNLILKIFRRCELNLVLSQGFNKMPKVSYSPALPIFIESDCELINFQTYNKLIIDKDSWEKFIQEFNKFSSNGIEIVEFKEITQQEALKEPKSLENLCQWAEYDVDLGVVLGGNPECDNEEKNNIYNLDKIRYIIDKCLSSDKFLITKKTKKGIEKTINYRDSIRKLELKSDKTLTFILKVGQNENIPALRADEFLKTLFSNYWTNNDDISPNQENDANSSCLDNLRIKRVNFFDAYLRII